MAALPFALAIAAVLAAGEAPASAEPGPAAAGPIAAPAASQPDREPLAALIRRSMAAYGGERARVRLGRVRAVGKVTSALHPGEVGRYTRVFSRSSRLRQEVAFPGSAPEVRVLDGARAFRYGTPAPLPVAATLQLQAARLDLPALLLEWEPRVADQGEVVHEGHKLRVLGLEIATGMRVEAGIDPQSGRILYVRGLARTGPRELELFTVYRDFRMMDGVLVPFQEEGWANGEPTGDVELSQVEFLDDEPESAFQP
jgi:hypothetical protein